MKLRIIFILSIFLLISYEKKESQKVNKIDLKKDNTMNIKEDVVLEKIIYQDINISKEFDKSFLKIVPEIQIKTILNKYKNDLGKLISIKKQNDKYIIEGFKGYCESKITLNKENKIISLWFNNIVLKKDSFESILRDFKKINAKKSLIVFEEDKTIIEFNSDEKLVVGSTFKLYVLKALQDKINLEKLSWDTQIPLKKSSFSLPSGILQDWQKDIKISLKVLANMMISISDNTASDNLIDFISREKLQNLSSLKPFLKTSEVFKLKWGIDSSLKSKYLNSDINEKIKILNNEIKNFSIKDVNFKNEVRNIEKIEWFFSTKELAKLIYSIKDNSSLSINLGFIEKGKYHHVAYKGGSEPGVLNYTFLIQKTKKSKIYTVSLTINDNKVLNNARYSEFITRIISLIK